VLAVKQQTRGMFGRSICQGLAGLRAELPAAQNFSHRMASTVEPGLPAASRGRWTPAPLQYARALRAQPVAVWWHHGGGMARVRGSGSSLFSMELQLASRHPPVGERFQPVCSLRQPGPRHILTYTTYKPLVNH
jgi:hypothetical protein